MAEIVNFVLFVSVIALEWLISLNVIRVSLWWGGVLSACAFFAMFQPCCMKQNSGLLLFFFVTFMSFE
jgi:hypothetical protein